MKKADISWLIVRVTGLGIFLNGCRYLFIVFENLLMTTKSDVGKTLLSQGAGLITGWTIEAIVYLIVGLIILLNGEFLFRIINNPSNEDTL